MGGPESEQMRRMAGMEDRSHCERRSLGHLGVMNSEHNTFHPFSSATQMGVTLIPKPSAIRPFQSNR
jgi:hypothetical protein